MEYRAFAHFTKMTDADYMTPCARIAEFISLAPMQYHMLTRDENVAGR